MKALSYSETRRGPNGKWLPGTPQKPGPGRKRITPEETLFKAARMLAPMEEAVVDHVRLARHYSGSVMARLVELAVDERTRPADAIAAATVVLERGFGAPLATSMNLNLNGELQVSPAERRERVQAALQKLREAFAQQQQLPATDSESAAPPL